MRTSLVLAALGLLSANADVFAQIPREVDSDLVPALRALAFTPNEGQWEAVAPFAVRLPGTGVARIDAEAIEFYLLADAPDGPSAQVVRLSWPGSRARRITPLGAPTGHTNHFLGADPSRWRTEVPTYSALMMEDVRPGLSIRLRDDGGSLAYDLIAAPGVDPADLRLRYEAGAGASLSPAPDESLLLATPLGVIQQSAPRAWLEDDFGRCEDVASRIEVVGDGEFRFMVPFVDPTRRIVVDPGLTWSAYLGGSGTENIRDIAVLPDGDVLLSGNTKSVDFPITQGPPVSLTTETFLTRVASDGSSIVFSTLVGGSGSDGPADLGLSADGIAYIGSSTSSIDIPLVHPVQTRFGGGAFDAAVFGVDLASGNLVFGTYLGGSEAERDIRVAAHPEGGVVVAADTASPDFPSTRGAFDTTPGWGGIADDIVVARIAVSSTTSELVFGTFLGGTLQDSLLALAVRQDGVIVVGGATSSVTDYPLLSGFIDPGPYVVPGVVTAFTPDGTGLVFSTFLAMRPNDIAFALDGRLMLAGWAEDGASTTPGAFLEDYQGGLEDAVVYCLEPDASDLVWGTYLGATGRDIGSGLAVDACGRVLVTGFTFSTDFPTTPGAHDTTAGGGVGVGFLAYLESDGSNLLYGSYVGESVSSTTFGVDVEFVEPGVAVVCGHVSNSLHPVTDGAFDTTYAGSGDAFVMKLPLHSPWTNLGGGLAGTSGLPRLNGVGGLCAGEPTSLDLTNALPGSASHLVIGLSALGLPFKQGTLVPAPDLVISGLPVDASGKLSISFPWPTLPSGATIWFQEWIADQGGPAGFAATPGLAAETP